jgi:hypothetical protein
MQRETTRRIWLMANTWAGRAVLDGQYEYSADFDAGTRELLEEVTKLWKLIPANSVDTCV